MMCSDDVDRIAQLARRRVLDSDILTAEPLDQFLTLCCQVSGNESQFTSSEVLVRAFSLWLERGGHSKWAPQTIARRLRERSKSFRHPRTGKAFVPVSGRPAGYVGIELTPWFHDRLIANWPPAGKVEADVQRHAPNLYFQAADAARRFPPLAAPCTLFCVCVFLGMALFVGLIALAAAL